MKSNIDQISIYLDWNVIIYLFEGQLKELEELLLQSTKENKIILPFSSIHIYEAKKIKNIEGKHFKEKMEYLSQLTANLYLYSDLNKTMHLQQHPLEVLRIIEEAGIYDFAFDSFKAIISYDTLKEIRKLINLSPSELNNISPDAAIKKINEALSSREIVEKYLSNYDGEISFESFLIKIYEIIQESNIALYQMFNVDQTNNNKVVEDLALMAFSFLNSFGFWTDNKDCYESGSHQYDCLHASLALYNKFLISEDRKFCMKARCVYNLLNVNTKVLHLRDDEKEILDIFESNKI